MKTTMEVTPEVREQVLKIARGHGMTQKEALEYLVRTGLKAFDSKKKAKK